MGSVLCHLLLGTRSEVRVLDNLMYGGRPLLSLAALDGFEFVRGDIRDRRVVEAALDGVDRVVHLAAIVGDPACARDPDAAREVNVEGARNVAGEALKRGVRSLVFASTCSNYGKMSDTSVLATEDHELKPVSLYAETKVAVERELLSLDGPTACTVLRFATLYGLSPRMRFDLTVNQFVMEALTARKLVVFGEQFWRPYVHVRDAARAVMCVLESEPESVGGAVFNVGDTRENYRKLDIVEMMRGRLPEFEVEFVHRDEDPRDYRVSFDRIRTRLAYTVSRTVPDGVGEVAAAIRNGVLTDLNGSAYYNVAP